MPEDRQLTAPATLLDIMRDRAERYRHKVAFDYSTGAEEHSRLSYHELDIKARAIASTLQRQGAAGERALPADEAPGRAGRGAGRSRTGSSPTLCPWQYHPNQLNRTV